MQTSTQIILQIVLIPFGIAALVIVGKVVWRAWRKADQHLVNFFNRFWR